MSTKTSHSIRLDRLSTASWVTLTVASFLLMATLWQFFLPFLAERHFRDGFNLGQGKRYKYAIEELQKAIDYAPWETHYMVQLGKNYELYAERQKTPEKKVFYYEKALALYAKMVILDDQNPWYINRSAIVYMAMTGVLPDQRDELVAKAGQHSRAAAEADKNNPLFQLNLGFFLHRDGKLDEAILLYQRVIEIDDRMLEARYNLGDIYHKKGMSQERLEQYLAIYEKNPEFPKIRLAIASTYIGLKQSKKALPFLEEALVKAPKSTETLRTLLSLYHRHRYSKRSLPYFERYFSLFPDDTKFFPYYIQALANTGRVSEATTKLSKFVKKHPKNTIAAKQLKALKALRNK